jgi:hypothetical protein
MAWRGWPTPNDLERMTWEEREAYFRSMGFDVRIRRAVASSDARAATEADRRI